MLRYTCHAGSTVSRIIIDGVTSTDSGVLGGVHHGLRRICMEDGDFGFIPVLGAGDIKQLRVPHGNDSFRRVFCQDMARADVKECNTLVPST
jgi:hypothetical protein